MPALETPQWKQEENAQAICEAMNPKRKKNIVWSKMATEILYAGHCDGDDDDDDDEGDDDDGGG